MVSNFYNKHGEWHDIIPFLMKKTPLKRAFIHITDKPFSAFLQAVQNEQPGFSQKLSSIDKQKKHRNGED